MIYTPLVRKAMCIAARAHAGQFDKAGYPYIHHPLHVAEDMPDEVSACAALLHDVMEDTPVTANDLRDEGIPEDVLDALMLLTHDDSIPYMDYVAALKGNPIARAVKLTDLRHNSDLSRLDTVDSNALHRLEKYKVAVALLMDTD